MSRLSGQGALGIECRRDDERVLGLVKRLEDYETRVCVEAERGFLTGLDGGCQVPIGAHARLDGDTVSLDGLVAEVDGSRISPCDQPLRPRGQGPGSGPHPR